MLKHDLKLYRGDTYAYDVVLTTEDGRPVDLSDAAVAMTVCPEQGDPISPELTVEGNTVRIDFAAGLTRDLTWRRARYDLQITRGGKIVTTVLYGTVSLIEDVTR